MAKSARKRTKRKPARRKSRAGKAAGHPRRKARPASRKVARRKSRKAVKHAPATNDTSWPVILTVMIVLLTGLVAAWQFGGAAMAANAAAYMPIPTAAEFLLLNDYGCGDARLAETWLMAAHPGLVPSAW